MTRRAVYGWATVLALLVAAAVGGLWFTGGLRSTGGSDAPAGAPSSPDLVLGPYRLAAQLDPETPRVGDNVLSLVLHDAQGEPVAGAAIDAVAVMAAMGAMPAMRAPADMREVEPGLYRGTFSPSMAGSWPLTLQIAHAEIGTTRVTFDLATGRSGLRPTSGAQATGAPANGAGDHTPEQRATFRVDPRWQQAVAVRTASVGPRTLGSSLRLPGRVEVDETRLVDVNLRTAGWIERLYVAETGRYVQAGERLFDLYSPDLVTAQRDLLLALESERMLVDSPSEEARTRTASLVGASRRRLGRLGLSEAQVQEVASGGDLRETLPILSPASGYVLDKTAVEGMRVEPGMRLFRIADLSTVWVLVDVYEGDAAFVELGQSAVFRLAYEPGATWRGRVDYVYPTLDRASRSVRIRLVFRNPELKLRPEMYGDVLLARETKAALAIPAEAVLDLGTRHVVFVDLGEGRIQAREVALGPETGGWYSVRAGLAAGESVIVSGNFLIDAESKVRGVVPLPVDDHAAESSDASKPETSTPAPERTQ